MINIKAPIMPGKWEIEYRYAMGPYASKFFDGLREKKILGIRCPSCKRVLLPPRAFCDRCFIETKDWVQVSDMGIIESFIIVYRKFYGLPDPPYALGLIKLKGADEGILHFICGIDLSKPQEALKKLKIGAKVRAVWSEKRVGSILDIKCFEVVE